MGQGGGSGAGDTRGQGRKSGDAGCEPAERLGFEEQKGSHEELS